MGLYTLRPVVSGQAVCEYTGQLVRTAVADALAARLPPHVPRTATYLFAVPGESSHAPMAIDATVKGGVARFINHSCSPSLEAIAVPGEADTPRVLLVARRDIEAGDELTYDYKLVGGQEGEGEACACGSVWCRRVL